MAAEVYRVEIPIIVDDQSDAPLERARERVNRFEQEARKRNEMTRKHFASIARLRIEPVMRVRDKLTAGVLKADKLVKMLGAEQAVPVLAAQDRVSAVVLRINQILEALEKNKIDVLADLKGPLVEEINEARTALVALSQVQAAPVAELRGKLFGQLTRAMAVARQLDQVRAEPQAILRERVMAKAREIMGTLRGLTSRAWNITLRVRDTAFGAIKRLTGLLTSPLGLLGAGAGIYGLGKATVGAAMTWETQAVSMEHWLKGNRALAREVTGWLERFAAATPFEMSDLFPAMSRAIGISEGDIKMAERMVKLAADMAGLTPGKTVQDAMEALADAQMGEFERMKEFQMKMTQEQYKALGGWLGFLKQAEARFAGGAEKLSTTAVGRISTITDNIKTLFRQAGIGILDALKPRLDAVTRWFDDNKATVERWKNELVRFGREGAEALLSWLERTFSHIRTRYLENPEFQRLDFAGKVSFVIDDLTSAFETWWSGPGGQKVRELGIRLGTNLISAMGQAAVAAVLDHPLLALLLGAYVGLQVPGPIPLKVAILASIVGTSLTMKFLKWLLEEEPKRRSEFVEGITRYRAIPGTGAYAEARIAEASKAWQWFEQKRAATPPGEPLIKGTTIGPARRAAGGLFSRPHLALVAEAGPEAIIPLSSRMRDRALTLWEETGRRLGVTFYADGGVTAKVPMVTPAVATTGFGPINVTSNITFNVTATDGQDVLQVIRAHRKAISDEITADIAEGLKNVFQNMTQ